MPFWTPIIVGNTVGQLLAFIHPGNIWGNDAVIEPRYKTQVLVHAGATRDGGDDSIGGTLGGYSPDIDIYDMYGTRPADGQKGKIIRQGEFYEYNLPHWEGDEKHGDSTRSPEYITLDARTPLSTVAVIYRS
jgi:hypothetical protein